MALLDQALENSKNLFATGEFVTKLGSLVNIVTDSKNALSADDLTSYYTDGLSEILAELSIHCLLYTSPSPRDATLSRMPSSA